MQDQDHLDDENYAYDGDGDAGEITDVAPVAESPEDGSAEDHEAIAQYLQIEQRFKSGANWFFWIAALSLVNSAVLLSGGNMSFVIGLGVTQIIDVIVVEVLQAGGVGKILAFAFDFCVAAIICGFGLLARKRFVFAFILGMIAYGIDGLILLLLGDFMSFAFHVFALFCIFSGLRACRILNSIEAMAAAEPAPAL